MNKVLKESLKNFLDANQRNRIENDGCAVWTVTLADLPYFDGKQPKVSFVFSRYQGNQANKTVLSDILLDGSEQVMGMVVALPSYWLSVDKYLCQMYIEYWIDEFVENFKSATKPSCPSQPSCPINPPRPPRPPRPPVAPIPPGYEPPQPPQPPLYVPPAGGPPMSPPRPGAPDMNEFNRMQ